MSRHVRQIGYKVVITGEGSDELFAGYPAFRHDMFLHGHDTLPGAERAIWEQTLAEKNQLLRGATLAEETVDDSALTALVGFTPSYLQPWLAVTQHVQGLIHKDRRAALRDCRPGSAIAEALDGNMLAGRHPLDQAQ